MHFTPALFNHVQRQGGGLYAQVLSRDNLHLAPALLSRAAAQRLRAGLRALEAFVRRLFILLALSLEPGLKPDLRERPLRAQSGKSRAQSHSFRIFQGETALPDHWPDHWPDPARDWLPTNPIHSAPLLVRLSALKALLDAPEVRARRLAFHMARHRPGLIIPPGSDHTGVPRRYGTEASAIYQAMAQAIYTAGRARPPPLDPVPRPGPRIRRL